MNYTILRARHKLSFYFQTYKIILYIYAFEAYIEPKDDLYVLKKEGNEYRIDTISTPDLERVISYDVEVSDIAKQFNITPSLYDDTIKDTNSDYKLSQKIIERVVNKLEKEINDYYNIKYATD